MGVVLAATVQPDTAELVLSCLSCAPYRLGARAPAQRQHLWKLERDSLCLAFCLCLTGKWVLLIDWSTDVCIPVGLKISSVAYRREKRGPALKGACMHPSCAVRTVSSPWASCWALPLPTPGPAQLVDAFELGPVLGPMRATEYCVHSTVVEACILSEHELHFFSIIKV